MPKTIYEVELWVQTLVNLAFYSKFLFYSKRDTAVTCNIYLVGTLQNRHMQQHSNVVNCKFLIDKREIRCRRNIIDVKVGGYRLAFGSFRSQAIVALCFVVIASDSLHFSQSSLPCSVCLTFCSQLIYSSFFEFFYCCFIFLLLSEAILWFDLTSNKINHIECR